jgi:ubiquinone/menaquinone biosynthesis C-methylase UbiE
MTSYVHTYFSKSMLYGIDPSSKSIKDAQYNYPAINFSINSEDSTTLAFEDSTFDMIFSAGTFHHIPFRMHDSYIAELIRILKNNGYLIIFELNPFNPLTIATFKANPIDKNAHMLSPWYTYSLLAKHGAPVTKFIAFFPNCLRFLRSFEKFLTAIPLGALYATIIKKKQHE